MAYDANYPADNLIIAQGPAAIRQKGADLKTLIDAVDSKTLDQTNAVSTYGYHYRDVAGYSTPGGVGANTAGTLKITLPTSWVNTMLKIKVEGYNHVSGGGNWSAELHGYSYGNISAWYNTSATLSPNCPFTSVRFGHDGAKCCILLGTTGTVWQYPQITISDVYASYQGYNQYATGWALSFITNETGITMSSTPNIKTLIDNTRTDVFEKVHPIGSFFVGGDASTFYPIIFQGNNSYNGFSNRLIIKRYTHQDGQWLGSTWLEAEWSAGEYGGNGKYSLVKNHHVNDVHVADFDIAVSDSAFVVWLRGKRTYYWGGSLGVTLLDYNAVASKTLSSQIFTSKTSVDKTDGYFYNGTPIATTAMTVNNSDTVDGKHASDFAPAGYGLGGRATALFSVDLNTLYNSGFYWVNSNCTNQPVASGAFHVIVQGGTYSGTTPQHFSQIATEYKTGVTYTRTCSSGTWSAWKRLATTDDIINYDTAHSFSANGYQKLSNGLIIQWGTTNSAGTTTFPIAFPTSCIALNVDYSANCETGIGTNGNKAGYISKQSVTTTGASIKFRWPAYTHDNSTGQWQEAYAQGATYIAIGY